MKNEKELKAEAKKIGIMKWLKKLFKKRTCNHGFTIPDILNLRIDPKCVKCGKTLSELDKEEKV